MKRFALIAALLGAIGLAVAGIASAAGGGSTTCDNSHQFGQVTITGNLNVPAGQTCVLSGTHVTGNISVGAGATLHTFGFTADGNVTVSGGFFVDNNYGFTILGNLTIDGSQGACCSANNGFWSNYTRSYIGKNFNYTNNLGWFYAEGGTTPPWLGGDGNDSWSEGATVGGNFLYSGNARPYQGGLNVKGTSNVQVGPTSW
jgi:hypothetical protein